MKIRIIALSILAVATIFVIAQSLPISRFPNTATPNDSDLFVLAQTQAPATNKNIRYDQLRGAIRSGMATEAYVNNATNGLATTNFVLSNLPANLWTNSGGIVMLTTNGPVSIASTGLLGGLVATQDIRFLGHNSASNSVWVCTNATTGEGEWRTFTGAGIAGQSDLLWTNAAGKLRPTITNVAFIGGGSNNNIASPAGFNKIGGGSENDIFANTTWGTIAGGFDNSVLSNTTYATVSGGQQNTAASNHVFVGGGAGNTGRGQNSVISGGDNNLTFNDYCIIGGGRLNTSRGQFSIVGGGSNNVIYGEAGLHNVIGGGQQNSIGAAATFPSIYSFIGGGQQNTVQNDCGYGVVGGGLQNNINGSSSSNSFIGGGAFNNIGNTAKFNSILGGERNLTALSAAYASIIGTSNNVTVPRALAIGHRLTNTLTDSLLLGSSALGAMKVGIARATNVTVGGTVISTTTAVASAGASETNLIAVTIPAHTLTNSQDRVTFRFSGRFAATANAKQLKVVYGSETILDTTSQIVNSGAWTVEGEIIRTGNTSQSVNAEYHGNGELLYTTAASLDLVQTNGIATVLKMTSTAAGDGDVTNRTATVWLWPAP